MLNKIYFFSFYLFLISSYCVSQNTFIPDDNFEQALIDLGYDTGALDDFVPTANIDTITELDISELGITDLTGIQDFTALSIFDCSDNSITSLDVTSNINITELYCKNNMLTALDVSPLSALKILWFDFNQITDINVTNNTNLISITCGDNLLTSIDISQNLSLTVLVCNNNQIPSIDVTPHASLNTLIARNNLLTSIDVTQNPNITFLDVGLNQISNIDVTNNLNLRVLLCFNNLLTSLDVTNNVLLSDLSCEFNQLTRLDMSNNGTLVNLDCSDNNLCWLDIKNGTTESVVDFEFNPNLSCVVVDDASIDYINWRPHPYSNFVSDLNECSNFVPVDTLQNFIGQSYTLPVLNNGEYRTEPFGNGALLMPGNIITSSQTIYIYNETVCNSNQSSFSVTITQENVDYFIPKYFTPNNDGNHDYWNVIDTNNSINSISIYNRYGKLLKFLLPSSQGWDGTLNGKLLPVDSYWYKITLNNNEVLRGYFALKR